MSIRTREDILSDLHLVTFTLETAEEPKVISFEAKLAKVGSGLGIKIPRRYEHLFEHRQKVLVVISVVPTITDIVRYEEAKKHVD